MSPGDLCTTDNCNLWNVPSSESPALIVGHLSYGEVAVILEVLGGDVRVISAEGVVGWIGGRHDRQRLHPV